MRSLISAALLCPWLMSCGLTTSCSGAEKPVVGPAKARAPDKLDELLKPSSAGLPGAATGPARHGAAAAPDFGPGHAATVEPTAAVRITVTGTARDAAMGAVVVLADGKVWYVDRLSEWPGNLLNAQVSVTGTARQRKLAPDPTVGPDGAVSHGMQGTSAVLMSAHWRAR
mgnify:CR=1 FL=1